METLERIQFDKLLKKLEECGLTGMLRLKTPASDPPQPTNLAERQRLMWDKGVVFTSGSGRNRFFIDHLGQRITDGSYLARSRELARQACTDAARLTGMSLKDPITQWGETGLAFQLHFLTSMEEAIPDLRLCSNHWKAEQLAKEIYPGWVRVLRNRQKEVIKQEGDEDGVEDTIEVDSSSPTLTNTRKRKPLKNRSPDSELRDPKRTKHQLRQHVPLPSEPSALSKTSGSTTEPTNDGPNVEPNNLFFSFYLLLKTLLRTTRLLLLACPSSQLSPLRPSSISHQTSLPSTQTMCSQGHNLSRLQHLPCNRTLSHQTLLLLPLPLWANLQLPAVLELCQ